MGLGHKCSRNISYDPPPTYTDQSKHINMAINLGCRDLAIILRQSKFKNSQSTNTFHNERKKRFSNLCLISKANGKKKSNHEEASSNVHFIYVTSLLFDVIDHLYPKEQE